MLAKPTSIAIHLRSTLAASLMMLGALFASPMAFSQNAVNTATVTPPATVTDPNTGNNSATDSDPITRTSNLTLTKTDSPDPVVVGGILTYTLTVSNAGPSAIAPASTFSIIESLPAGLTGCSFTPSVGTFSTGTIAPGATGTGTWSGATIPSGGSVTLTIACSVDNAAAATITNTATVIPPTGTADPDCSGSPVTCAGGNTASAGTTVNRPQLTLTKTATPNPFVIGQPASYTLTLTNTGTAATTASSTITDNIPAGLTIGTPPAGCGVAGQTVTCTVSAGLAAGGNAIFVIPVTPTAAAATPAVNTATVTGGGDPTCPAAARCNPSVTTPINAPQLTLTKTASPSPFVLNQPATYTLTLSNTGTAATTAISTITDVVPNGVGIGTLPAGCTNAGQTVTCTVPAGLAAGGSTSFVIPVTPTAAAASPVVNTASVTGGGDPTCPAAARCSSTTTTPVNAPQLTLTKTASTASFTVGTPATYTLSVQNTGTAATTAVATITDTIPTGLTIGTLPAGCTAAGQVVTCTIPAGLAVSATTSFVIPVTPTAAAADPVVNTANVSGGGDPTCPAAVRCSSSTTTPVNRPQLTLTKTASPTPFVVGTPATYTLTLQNTGTAATTATSTITDTIPTGLTIGTLPAGCTAAGQTVTCTVPAGLAAGSSTNFIIPVTPTASVANPVVNTASVSGGGDPTCPAAVRCSSSTTTPVNAVALTITKTASAASFVVGVPASYTLSVQNTGTAATTAVATITDTIPTGLTIGTLPAGCTAAGQVVTCTIPAGLAVSATTSFVIPVTPTATAASPAVNTATVNGGGDAGCPAAARCSSTTTTPINSPALTITKTASTANFTVGTPVNYTLSVQNTGTAATTAVATITDTIPTGLTIGTLPAGCTAAGQVVTCTIPAGLAVNATTSFVIPVTPTAAAASPVTNTATVSGGGDAGCPAAIRCSSSVTNPVNRPQLTLTKAAVSAAFTVGIPANYTLTVQNTGTATTTAPMTIIDTVPTGLTIGTLPGSCSVAGQTITCTLPAGLVPTGTTGFTIPVIPTSAAAPSVTNTATVSGGGDPTCPAATRCSSSVTTPVNRPVLTITKIASAATFTVGQPASYTLQVSNSGTSATPLSATITDTIPASLIIGTLPAGCTAAGQTVTCAVPLGIPVGGSTSFVIPVTPTIAATPSVTNTATVSGGGDSTCPADARCTSTTTTPVNTPQLTLTKTASAASFVVGVPASYTLSLQNTGTATTFAVSTITDTIPTGLTIGTLPVGCTAAGQTVTCTVPAGLAVGGSTSFVIPVTPTLAATPSVTNTASVTGGGDPTCPADARCSSTTTTPVNTPQLTLVKTAAPTPFVVGQPASYTLSLSNTGTAATTAVATITDTIPTGLTIGTLPAGCTVAGQTVTCTVPAGLAVGGGSTSFVIPVTPTLAATPSVTNTASVSGGGDPTCPADARCSSTTTTPVNTPQLTLVKTATPTPFVVGAPASYTLSLSNTGTAATTAVATITDTIPTGLTIGTLLAGCTVAGQTVTCTVPAGLAAGGSTSFVIPVTPTLAATPSVTNTASVTGGGDPTCPANARCSSTTTTPVNTPQLTLVKTATPTPFVVGAPASYTLSLSNTGTAATTAVATITDTIPTGLTIGTLPAGCTAAGQTVTCTVPAGLAAGGSTSFVIPVTPTLAATPSVTNTASVTGGGDPTCPADARCSSTTTTPVNTPQLTLTKTASAATFTVGQPASYTLSLSNTGTAATTAVATITDTIPTSLTIGTLPAGCTAAGQTVTCTVPAGLAAGGSTSFVIPVTPTLAATPSVTNTASVSGGGDPTCPADARCSSTTTTPVNTPQLTLVKTASPSPFVVGQPASYTLSLSNTGTAATTAVATITDTIPASLTIGTLPAGCTAAGQTVTCTVPAGLAAGGSTSFVIPVTPTLAATPSVTNTASVTGGGDPTCPADARCSSTTTTPVNTPQLTLTKTASAATFTVGQPASYTLSLSNTGTAATTAVATITDTIPTSLTIGTLPAGCTAAGQTVTCTVPVGLAAGGSTSFVIPVVPTAAAQPSVTNTANVSGGGDPTCPAAARCSSTVTTPVVAPPIQAQDDTNAAPVNGATGGVAYTSVLNDNGNGPDTLNGVPATLATVAISVLTPATPIGGGPVPTLNPATGQVTVPAGTPAGPYTIVYRICEILNPTNCDDATVTVTVTAPLIVAEDDSNAAPINGATGGVAYTSVLNDNGNGPDTLNGVPATLTTVTITPLGGDPELTLNPATGEVTVAANTPAGTYTIDYEICEVLNPTNCDPATVTVTVVAPAIDAVNDTGTVANGSIGGVAVPNVLVNDTFNGAPATFATVAITTIVPATPIGGGPVPVLNPTTGEVAVPPGTPAGTYTITYTICDLINPTNCDTATVTVTVGAAVIDAVDDSFGPIVGATGGTTPTVLTNDTLGGNPVTVGVGGNVTLTPGAAPTPAAGSLVMNPDGTITVAAGTTAGTYLYPYTICEVLNPTNCDTATATVVVSAAVIDAVNDTGTVANGSIGGVAVPNVLVNDTLNGVPATLATVTITQVSTTNPNVTINPATGAVNVAPGTPAGTYTLVYQICEILNPTNCDTATVTVTVGAAVIDAVDDSFGPIVGAVGGTTPTVLTNDTLGGNPVTVGVGGNVTLTPGAAPTPAAGSITMNPDGTITIAPGTTAGTYLYPYTICEVLNPTNCDTATATVVVSAAVIDAVNDTFGPVNGATGNPTAGNAFANDTLNGAPVNPAAIVATVTTPATPIGGGPVPTLDTATGNVSVPAGTPAGSYTITYQICELLNPTNCDTATITVTVTAAPIVAQDDSNAAQINGATGGVAYTSVLNDNGNGPDTLNGVPATLATVTITQVSTTNPNVTLNPATGAVNVAPGTPAGTYTLVYQICEILNPTNCDTATVTVTVVAPVIVAQDDTNAAPVSGATGGVAYTNVLNDNGNGPDTLNGVPATFATVSITTIVPATPIGGGPVPVLNPATGEVTVAPNTPAGPYTITYTICDLVNPTNCDTALVTVQVAAPPIVAQDDTNATPVNGATGGVAYTSVLNDNGNGPDTLNGVPATLSTVTIGVVTPAAPINGGPVPTLNPATGQVTVPAGTPAGTYTIVYQICEVLNPTNCDQATITVPVIAAPIDAVNDTFGPVNGATGNPNAGNAFANDTLNGAPVNPAAIVATVTTPATPIGGGPVPTLDTATGNVSVPAGTPAGTYTIVYQICEVLNPTNCDQATITVTVLAALIVAQDDSNAAPVNGATGGVAYTSVLNDNGNGPDTLNGVPATLTTVTITPLGGDPELTLNPATGEVTVAANTPAGTYTIDYEICEVLNPTNCDPATVTVTVAAAPIVANPDTATGINGFTGAPAVVNVLTNDTLNGVPVSLTTVAITTIVPATPIGGGPVPVLNPATGNVDVPAGTPAGTYTITYTICEQLNPTNCSTTTATITVVAAVIDAVNDTFGPVNGATGNPTAGNAFANDTLNGAPVNPAAIVATVTTPATPIGGGPVPTLDTATGNVSVPAGTPAGSYTITYQICELLNPTNCDTATITVTVLAALIVAEDDSNAAPINGATGGVAYTSVLNDNGNGPDTLNGVPATLTTVTITPLGGDPELTLNPATGEVTVAANTPAGTYTIDYEICEVLNPTNCDPATVTVTVVAPAIDAVNDTGTVANGSIGGVAVPNVLVNDTFNGAPATFATVAITTIVPATPIGGGPVPVLNPTTGEVAVPPGTPAGTYTITYTICDLINPTNCDTATVTVTVGAAVIDAVDDSFGPIVGATGGTTPTVLTNDTLGGNPVTVGVGGNVTLTPGAAPTPAAGSLVMNPDGTITVAAGTTAGTYLYPYTICEVLNPTNCDTATATVVVSAAVIDAVNDTGTVANGSIGGVAVPNVLVNDTLNGVPATLATVTITQVSTTNPNVTINPATGAVNVAPGTPAGTYTLVYQICEILNPTNCDTATVTVTVGAAVIDAVDDSFGPIVGAVGGNTPSVLINDTLGGNPVTVGVGGNVTLTPGAAPTPAAGSLVMNPDGTITVAAGTTAGTYLYPYTICEVLNPTNCDTATATVVVSAAVIDAVNDTFGPVNGATGNPTAGNAFANDTLNGAPVNPAAIVATVTTPATPIGGGPVPTLDTATGNVSVPAGTPAGSYTITYQICELLNPTNCDTATITVTVTAALIVAEDDSNAAPVNGATGGVAYTSVLNDNGNGPDTLNGVPATLTTVTITPLGGDPELTLNPATGEVTVAANTPAGTYTIDYEICEVLNPTNCDPATVTVTVVAPAIDAVNDTGTVANGSIGGVAVPNVLVNDTFNGAPATFATVAITTIVPATPIGGGPVPVLNPTTGEVAVPPGTPAGAYTITYTICDLINPTNCDTATVTVTVGAAVIDAVDDSFGPIVGAVGGTTPTVLTNDTLGGNPVTVGVGGNVTLTPGAAPTPAAGSLVMNPDGTITVAPGTTAGTYLYPYTICEVLNPTNCDTATATVVVSAAVIDAVNDTGTVANGSIGGVAVPNVLVNDTLNGVPATLATVTITQVSTTNPNVTINPATGAVNVAPGTPAGTYTLVYQICEILNPTNCDTATVTVTVGAAVIDAVDDSFGPIVGAVGGNTPSVLINDTLGGNPVTVGVGGNVTLTPGAAPTPAAGSLVMNPDGTITVAAGTTAGTYLYPYTICEVLNPTNCDTATATVVVSAAVIDAVNDTFGPVNGATGNPTAGNAFANDTLNGAPVNPAAIVATVTTPATPIGGGPVPTLDTATGNVSVPAGTPAGSYTITYQICELLNPTNCDTATITVTVTAALIVAEDDSNAAPVNGATGGVAYTSVLNDNGNGPDTLNGVPATLTTVTITPLGGDPELTLNPATGEVTVAANTPAGTYTIDYEICEVLNPTNCDPATVTVTVVAPAIDAVNDTGTVANGSIGGVAVPNVLVNDTFNGAPATFATVAITTIVPATPIGGGPVPVLNPTTGEVAVPPGTPAGAYTITYTICDLINPTNCDTATVTVTVGAAVIDAVDDSFGPIVGAVGGTTPTVLTNDTLGGNPVTVGVGGNVTLTPGAAPTPAAGSLVMNPDGTITVAAGTTAGTYLYPYTICEVLNPTNCDTATATVVVGAAVIVANPDTATGINGLVGAPGVVNVLTNDTLNGVPVTLATVTITTVVPATPINGGPVPVLNPATGLVDVPAGTPAGTYTITYTICENLNPTNCSTTTVTITVVAAVIDAVDDAIGPVNGSIGNPNAGNVFTNDTLNGTPVNPATITATVVTPATPINGGPVPTLDTATGNVSVPPGTPAGTYTIVYQICENLNPTNCDTATVTITVTPGLIDAVDDPFPAVPATGGTTPSVLANDTLNGNPVVPAAVTLTPGTAPTPASGSIVMNPDGTITIAPNTEAGSYTYPYTICEAINPTNCDTAVATVIVSAAPGLSIDKTAGTPSANNAGGTIAYSFLVTNTGNVTVSNLVINDAQLSAPAVCPVTTLAPGASTTCTGSHTITQAEVDTGVVTNTATATGSLPGQGTVTSPPDTTSTTIAQTPAISAVKTATITTDNGVPGAADEGDVITYNVVITNSGNVTLTGLTVVDSLEGRPATTLACAPTTLAPGAIATCTSYTYTLTAADAAAGGTLDNVVTATARTSNQSSQVVTATGAAVVAINGDPAQVRVVKTASPRDVRVGDLVRYTVVMENTGLVPVTDGTLIDTPPAGFTYVDGSLTVVDTDNAGRLVGTYPIRVDQIDIPAGGRATITYLLRVGAGVRAGTHTNHALLQDNGDTVSNEATADVQLVGDPLLDESLIVGTVFNDRDGDQWQDSGDLSGVRVQGGFAPAAYIANSTTVDRGDGAKPEPDASSPMLHGIDVGAIAGRQSDADSADSVVISQTLRELSFSDDFVLTSAQGTKVRMAADGTTRVEKSGDAAKGLTAAEPKVERRVSQVADGYRVDYVISNIGIAERGVPGVRIASVEGVLIETDQYGRYRLVGVDGGRERGRNFILKVDPATLPPGTTFTTGNPLVRRVTPGVPTRFDFGVKLPQSMIEGGERSVEMELGSVMFAPGSAEIRAEYRPAIEKMAETAKRYRGGEVVIGAEGENDMLAFERAIAVREALAAQLPADVMSGLRMSVRANPHDPSTTVVGVLNWPLIGTMLFETDRAEIKAEYRPLIRRIAKYLEQIGTTQVAVVGHADKRGSDEYNVALGMRRARAVFDAIAEALPPQMRSRLRVDVNEDPAAPVGMNGQ